MSSIIHFVRNRFFNHEEERCLILGLDAAGKTTLLYQLKLGMVVTTIPTVGFNVETLQYGGRELTCWDVGGCDKIRPLTRHYFTHGMTLLFIIDSHDKERLTEAIEELCNFVRDISSSHIFPFFGVMLNKQDMLITREEVYAIRQQVEEAILVCFTGLGHSIPYRIYDEEGTSGLTGKSCWSILHDVMRSHAENLKMAHDPNSKPEPGATRTTNTVSDKGTITLKSIDEIPTKEQLLEKIKARKLAIPVTSIDDFFVSMELGQLQVWDHGIHIFAAWAILAKTIANPVNVTTPMSALFIAVDEFLVHLKKMLEASTPGKFRNTLHRTMTTFWFYEIYVAMINSPTALLPFESSLPASECCVLFYKFLEHNPMLMYGGMWKEHYSKDLLFSPKAKENWCLPDLKPLSAFPTPAGITGQTSKPNTAAKGYGLQDTKDVQSNERLKQWAYALLQRVKATKSRRGPVVYESLLRLQRETMQKRAVSLDVEPYSETQAYFWIQIVHAGIEGVERQVPGFDVTTVGFASFILLFPDAFGHEDLWRDYYDEETWRGVEARTKFTSPKKGKVRKAIPNFTVIKEVFDGKRDWRSGLDVRVPNNEELAQRVSYMGDYLPPAVANPDPIKTPAVLEVPKATPVDEDDEWVEVSTVPPAPPLPSTTAVPKSIPTIESTTKNMSDIKLVDKPDWHTHAALIYAFFSKFAEISSPSHILLSRAAYFTIRNLTLNPGSHVIPVNTATFWSRLILEKFMETYNIHLNSDELDTQEKEVEVKYDFKTFLQKNPELAWEGLSMVYYNELTLKSIDAFEAAMKPDRTDMRAFMGR